MNPNMLSKHFGLAMALTAVFAVSVPVKAQVAVFATSSSADSQLDDPFHLLDSHVGSTATGSHVDHTTSADAHSAGYAGRGLTKASTHVQGGFLSNLIARANADSTVFDLVFTAPKGQSHVTTSFNVLLGGTYTALNSSLNGEASGNASINVTIGNNTFNGNLQYRLVGDGFTTHLEYFQTGPLMDHFVPGPSQLLTTPLFTVPVGVPITFSLSLATVSQVLVFDRGAFALADTGFGHTLILPTGSPIFNLPTGFSAQSVDSLIVDNRWLEAQSVPEPGALMMLGGFSVMGTALIVRRRRG